MVALKSNKITKALMIAFLINGGFSLAENNPITPGTNLGGENATAIGAGSVSAGSESSSIGTNTFASGNNMTKEEYLKFLKDNKERLSKIEAKMQEIKNDKDEIQKLRQEHDDIINKIDRINNYKKAIEDKEKELNEKEPQILKTIEEKRTETIKFTKEIEDLNKRLNMINTLDVSKLNEDNLNSGITELAKDLKQKMETGSTFLKQYGENGIPLEQYENYIKSIVANKQQFYKNENFKVINNTNFQITDGILYTKDRKIKKYYISNNDNYNIVKDFFYEMSQAYITCDDTFDGFKQWIANKKNAKKYGYDGSYDIDRLEKVTEREFNEVKNNILNNNKINFDGKIIISDDELTNSDYDQLIEYGGTHGYYAQAGVHYNKIYSQLNGTGDKGFHFDVHVPLHINEQNKDEILHRLIKEPVIRYAATISKINSILKEKGLLYNKIADLTPIEEDSVGSMDDFTFNTINYIREDLYVKDGINYKAIDWLKENVNNIKQAINSKKNIDCKDKNLCILKDEFVKNEIKNQFNIMKTKCAEYEKLTNDNLDNEKFAALMIFYAGFAVPKDIYSGYNYNLSNDSKLSYDKQWEYEGTLKGVIDYLVPGLININYKKTLVTDKLINILNKENDRLKTIDDSKKFIKIYQNEIDRLKRLERDANTYITEKEELIKGYKNDIENLKSLLNSENPSDVEKVNKQIQEKEEKIKKALADIENLKKNLTEIKPGTNALAYGTNSAALGKDSIAFGTNNIAINESSIAFGTNNFVNGNKSIALGYGHKVIGDRSVTLGDPNLIFGNDNFAIGNNIKIGTETQKVNNNLVFGTNITIDGISNAIVFGNESKAIEGAVSFGNDTTTRKLKYIAEGTDDTDAVNFSQLKDYVKKNAKGKTVNIKNELISKLNYDPDTYLKIDENYLQYINGEKESPKLPVKKKLSLNIDGVKDALGKDSDIANPKDKFVTDKKVHDYVTTNFVSKDSLDLTKFLKSEDVDVTGDGKYITVTSTNNKYKVAFNESELTNTINNSDFTSNKSIQDMLSKKANKDASNLEDTDVTKWQDKLGNGTVTDKDNGLVKGTTVFNYINPIKTQVDQLGTSLNDKLSDITINGDTYIKTEKASKGVYNLSLNEDTLETLINSKTADLAKNDTITNINKELDKKANLDASNLKEQDVKDWQAKLGNGKVDKDNKGLVTGNTVYEVKEDLNKKITTNAENITKLNNTYTTLNNQVTTNTSDISKLKTTVDGLKNTKQDITNINNKLGNIDKSITNINTTLDAKLDKADLSITGDKYIGVKKDNKFNYTLSFNKTNLEKDLDLTNNNSINNMFTTKLGDINTNIGDLKTKVETNTNNINSLTTKVDDNSNKISDLTTKVETNTNNINSLTTKVNTNTKDITTLKKDMTNKLNVDGDNLTTQGETNLTNKLSKGSDISNPKNRLVTDTKVKQYLDTNFKIQNYVVGKEVLDIKKDAAEAVAKAGLALGGVANAIAMANLTTTESGIANLTAAYGTYGKEHALAIGFNGNTPNRRFNYKFGLSTNMKGNLGIGAGVGFVIGGTTEQRQTQQERKIKALEKQLQEMSEVLKKLQLKK